MDRLPPALALIALALAGCGRVAPPLDSALEARAKATIVAEFVNRRPVEFGPVWLASFGSVDGIVCGRLAAPRPIDERGEDLRFVYMDRYRHGQVEMRDAIPGGPQGGMLLEQNRRLFDQLWTRNCAPAEPSPSWFAGIFS